MQNSIPDWMIKEVVEYDLDINPAPQRVLDIGANIGAFSTLYAKKWPQAQIHSYEPVVGNYDKLRENCLGCDRIHVSHAAIRSFNGNDQIYIGDRGVTCSFHQLGRQTKEKQLVNCLDAAALPQADLVKIDTEGCELEILQRMNAAGALRTVRALVVEYHRFEDLSKISAVAELNDFKLLQHIPGSESHGVLKFGRDPGVTVSRVESAKARKIYVAVAGHYANNDTDFIHSLLALVVRPPCSLAFGWMVDPSVTRARNILSANFLETDCTHLLFIDGDITFTNADVQRISSHQEKIVGGFYPLKKTTPSVQWCANSLADKSKARPDGLMPVKYAGTGFLCIAREVFQTMIERKVVQPYVQDFEPHRHEYAFFRDDVRLNRFLTEDWMFCQTWIELGGEIFLDTHVVLKHAGRAVWPLPIQTGNPFTVETKE